MTVAERGYSVVVPPLGSWVRQGHLVLQPQSLRWKHPTPVGELEQPTSGWHRSTDRLDGPRDRYTTWWTLRTRCGRPLCFEPEIREDARIRYVIEIVEFPVGHVCGRCL